MIRPILLFSLAVFLMVPRILAQDLSEIQQEYVNFLTNQGFQPEVDGDGDVVFKHEGKTYFLEVNENDPDFFRMALPNIWAIETEDEGKLVMRACNYASSKTKVAKVFTLNDNVWISCEILLADFRDYRQQFERCLSVINTAKDNFLLKMRME